MALSNYLRPLAQHKMRIGWSQKSLFSFGCRHCGNLFCLLTKPKYVLVKSKKRWFKLSNINLK